MIAPTADLKTNWLKSIALVERSLALLVLQSILLQISLARPRDNSICVSEGALKGGMYLFGYHQSLFRIYNPPPIPLMTVLHVT